MNPEHPFNDIPVENPEQLSLWDRWFNRYRETPYKRGSEQWCQRLEDVKIPGTEYDREYVIYKVVDRLTGSVRLQKRFL